MSEWPKELKLMDGELAGTGLEGGCKWSELLPEWCEEFLRRYNAHDELVGALERDEELANAAILRTPAGEYRNKLTEINILRLQALESAKEVKE
jgi:hypothetical protein